MDSKDIIKAEIERLRKNLPWGGSAVQMTMECNCKNEAYTEIEKFINSLPEEPVSEDLESKIEELHKRYQEVSFAKLSRIAVSIAKWQKEKIGNVIKQYSDKGEKNYQDTLDNYEDGERSNEFYWDGYRDCANGIKRELED